MSTAPTGLLIPPSNVLITFSLVSGGTSVAALFMAGYIPGILWGLFCMAILKKEHQFLHLIYKEWIVFKRPIF